MSCQLKAKTAIVIYGASSLPAFSLSNTLWLGYCESMLSALQSHTFVLVKNIQSGNPFFSFLAATAVLYYSVMLVLFLFYIIYLFFISSSSGSHRETANHIEAIADRAVRASKQTYSSLMDLLQDNSTEEYIRNLTEQ